MTKKFYAVKIGKKIGVFNNWNDAKKHVDGVSGAIYKSFSTLIEAKAFLKQTQSQTPKVLTGPIAYVDGSYFEKYKKYGSGVYIRDANDSKTLKQYSFSGKKIEFLSARNVAGECLASLKAME
jgi:ribonuclease HI